MELSPEPVPQASRAPRPWRFWLVVAVVATGVLGLALAQRRTGGTPAPTPSTTPLLRVVTGSVCSVSTDRQRHLSVSFTLVNQSDVPVRLLDVRPSLPLDGLRWLSTEHTPGTCQQPGGVVGETLLPGGSLLVTFEFTVPAGTCPQPYPVQVSFQIDAGGTVADTTLSVLNDLGEVRFDACPIS